MKRYRARKLHEGRFIVGIDPAKQRHDAVIVDPAGIPVGRSFWFKQSFTGHSDELGAILATDRLAQRASP
jgi:hypothetical protein